MNSDDTDQILDRAWQALDDGDVEAARALARRAADAEPALSEPWLLQAECALADDDAHSALAHAGKALDLSEEEEELLTAIVLKAGIELELEREDAARRTVAALPPPDVDIADLALALDVADIELAVGEATSARARFQRVADEAPDQADAWYGLGLAAEALGDEEGKRAAWLRALALDASTPSAPERLSEAEFAEIAEEALAELPARARELLREVPIVIAERPARADVATGLDPRLLGLFSGTAYPESSSMGGVPHLTQILLFRDNLERAANDADELGDEIRTTLLHETGHFFGMDEDDLEAVGLD